MRERRGQRMNKVWYGSGSAPLWLRVAARLFGAVAVLRGGLYRRGLLHSRKLAVPVVVVGKVYYAVPVRIQYLLQCLLLDRIFF